MNLSLQPLAHARHGHTQASPSSLFSVPPQSLAINDQDGCQYKVYPAGTLLPPNIEDSNRQVTSILIAHNNPVVVAGLLATLRREEYTQFLVDGDHEALGTVGWKTTISPPDIIVADYQSAIRHATSRSHMPKADRPRIMVVTERDREGEIRSALERGADAYLLCDCGLAEYTEAIAALMKGGRYVCSRAARCLTEALTHETLTRRELDVLKLMIDGHSNKVIGSVLNIALGTVKAHVKGILQKLDAKSRTQAVSLAAARGIGGQNTIS